MKGLRYNDFCSHAQLGIAEVQVPEDVWTLEKQHKASATTDKQSTNVCQSAASNNSGISPFGRASRSLYSKEGNRLCTLGFINAKPKGEVHWASL